MFALRVLRWRGSCCVPRQRNGHIVMSSVGVGVSQCATSRFLVSVSGFRTKCGIETAKRPALGSHDERRLRTNAHLRNAADGVNRSVSRFLRLVSLLDFCLEAEPSVSQFLRLVSDLSFCVCYASKPSPQFLSFCGWFRISVSASVTQQKSTLQFLCVTDAETEILPSVGISRFLVSVSRLRAKLSTIVGPKST